MDHLCYSCARLFIDALWSRKGLTSWLSFVSSSLSLCILGQLWCLVVLIPDLFPLSYFKRIRKKHSFLHVLDEATECPGALCVKPMNHVYDLTYWI